MTKDQYLPQDHDKTIFKEICVCVEGGVGVCVWVCVCVRMCVRARMYEL